MDREKHIVSRVRQQPSSRLRSSRAAILGILLNMAACRSAATQAPGAHYYRPSLERLNTTLLTNTSSISLGDVWQFLLEDMHHDTFQSEHTRDILRDLLRLSVDSGFDNYALDRFHNSSVLRSSVRTRESNLAPIVTRYHAVLASLTLEERDALLQRIGRLLPDRNIRPETHDHLLDATLTLLPLSTRPHSQEWWDMSVALNYYGITAAERRALIAAIIERYPTSTHGGFSLVGETSPDVLVAQLRNGVVTRATLRDLADEACRLTLARYSPPVIPQDSMPIRVRESVDVTAQHHYEYPDPALAIKLQRAVLREFAR